MLEFKKNRNSLKIEAVIHVRQNTLSFQGIAYTGLTPYPF